MAFTVKPLFDTGSQAQGPNSMRGSIHAMGRKIEFLNRFTNLSLEINHIDSHISFGKKPGFMLQIGDHFFLNLGPVLITFHCFLFSPSYRK
jgi:hypothetical protein